MGRTIEASAFNLLANIIHMYPDVHIQLKAQRENLLVYSSD